MNCVNKTICSKTMFLRQYCTAEEFIFEKKILFSVSLIFNLKKKYEVYLKKKMMLNTGQRINLKKKKKTLSQLTLFVENHEKQFILTVCGKIP